MIAFTAKTLLSHKVSFHDPATPEGARLNAQHAALIAKDIEATKEAQVREAIRMKLGKVPPLIELRNRLEIRQQKGTHPLNWLVLDGEAIAVFTDPRSVVRGFRYIVSWHWKNLVDHSSN